MNNDACYVDGRRAIRCEHCHSQLRDPAGDQTVSIRVKDVEAIACILEQYVNCPEVWGETIKRLEQAVGRTVRQICAEELESLSRELRTLPEEGK